MGSHRRRNHQCQILVRLIEGLGATGAQNRGFPIDSDRRPYNSVVVRIMKDINNVQENSLTSTSSQLTCIKINRNVLQIQNQIVGIMF